MYWCGIGSDCNKEPSSGPAWLCQWGSSIKDCCLCAPQITFQAWTFCIVAGHAVCVLLLLRFSPVPGQRRVWRKVMVNHLVPFRRFKLQVRAPTNSAVLECLRQHCCISSDDPGQKRTCICE